MASDCHFNKARRDVNTTHPSASIPNKLSLTLHSASWKIIFWINAHWQVVSTILTDKTASIVIRRSFGQQFPPCFVLNEILKRIRSRWLFLPVNIFSAPVWISELTVEQYWKMCDRVRITPLGTQPLQQIASYVRTVYLPCKAWVARNVILHAEGKKKTF